MQRGVDQIIHDICLQNIPVTMISDRAGLVGEDGETHHGTFDIALFGAIPNLVFYGAKGWQRIRSHVVICYKLQWANYDSFSLKIVLQYVMQKSVLLCLVKWK